ncbi:MAG TPA: hypothetical protein VFZ09_08470 [Archangium sp.]|uniref:hypothetical protein n=1 Tax=Archangium sp. TaxID=1872627 RepID=UPI002E3271E4|nr:hypothetical protein [Archangium sp.]HEX5746265.1 hypothetical protein [Archangium sp.]
MNQPRLVRINWIGPFAPDKVPVNPEYDDNFGLYQIYGIHEVFGPQSLLYIGKAEHLSFAERINQHLSNWLSSNSDAQVRLGLLHPKDYKHEPKDWSDWKQLLRDTEALTIFWHTPPYNSRNISHYSGPTLRVQNFGQRGRLLPEFSTDWVPPKPMDSDEE